MTHRSPTVLLLACAAAGMACGRDQGVGPDPDGGATGHGRVLTAFELTPAVSALEPGSTLRLVVVFRDQQGAPMSPPGTITYASDAPEIATVSSTGVVTGVARGVAVISAAIYVWPATWRAAMTTHVGEPPAPGALLLSADDRGWQPAVVLVAAGSTVRWSAGPTNWAGMPHTTLWLMDVDFTVVDRLDLRGGSATRRLDAPGTFRYCSGSCWDPPDWGVIHVR